MSSEQMRAEFEAWAVANQYATKTDNVGYCHPATTMAWRAWQASRAALVVELPDIKSTFYPNSTERARAEEAVFWCRNKILDAGIKVAPEQEVA